MKNTSYHIVQISFQTNDVNYVFIETLALVNQDALDQEDLMAKLELKAKNSAEKLATNKVLEQFESDEVDNETLSVLVGGSLEQAISEKYQYIKALNLDEVTLLNNVTSIDDDKELVTRQYTQDVVAYFKANKEDFPSLNTKALSTLRDIAVKFMLGGAKIEQALDKAYDEVMSA